MTLARNHSVLATQTNMSEERQDSLKNRYNLADSADIQVSQAKVGSETKQLFNLEQNERCRAICE